MQGRLGADRVDLPLSLAVAANPLERPAPPGVAGLPGGPEREVDLSIPVDVVRGEADVVRLGRPLQNDVLFPGRVLEPGDRVFRQRGDVGLAITIDVGRRHRVADLADLRVDLLGFKSGEIGGKRAWQAVVANSTTGNRARRRIRASPVIDRGPTGRGPDKVVGSTHRMSGPLRFLANVSGWPRSGRDASEITPRARRPSRVDRSAHSSWVKTGTELFPVAVVVLNCCRPCRRDGRGNHAARPSTGRPSHTPRRPPRISGRSPT